MKSLFLLTALCRVTACGPAASSAARPATSALFARRIFASPLPSFVRYGKTPSLFNERNMAVNRDGSLLFVASMFSARSV